jgi:hypothetical protein
MLTADGHDEVGLVPKMAVQATWRMTRLFSTFHTMRIWVSMQILLLNWMVLASTIVAKRSGHNNRLTTSPVDSNMSLWHTYKNAAELISSVGPSIDANLKSKQKVVNFNKPLMVPVAAIDMVLSLTRCGAGFEEDISRNDNAEEDMYDDYYDDESMMYDADSEERHHHPTSMNDPEASKQSRSSPSKKRKSNTNAVSSVTKTVGALASAMHKTANVMTSTAVSSLEGTVKMAAPKFVSLEEIMGTWRIDQQVDFGYGEGPVSCAANVQLFPRRKVTSSYKSKTYESKYKFTQRKWPRHCTIEFDAYAFQGPMQKEPIRMIYKGVMRRKIMQHSVIKIHGKIYEERPRKFGRQAEQVLVGNFVARRRFTAGNNFGIISQSTTCSEDGNASDADNSAYAYDDFYDDDDTQLKNEGELYYNSGDEYDEQ